MDLLERNLTGDQMNYGKKYKINGDKYEVKKGYQMSQQRNEQRRKERKKITYTTKTIALKIHAL